MNKEDLFRKELMELMKKHNVMFVIDIRTDYGCVEDVSFEYKIEVFGGSCSNEICSESYTNTMMVSLTDVYKGDDEWENQKKILKMLYYY